MTRYDSLVASLDAFCAVDSVSADEGDLRSLLTDELRGLVDTVQIDPVGSVIATRSASDAPRLLFAVMDEPGLVVTHIDTCGLLHVSPIGEVAVAAALNARVGFRNGVQGIVVADESEAGKPPEFTKLRIDLGVTSREDAQSLVSVGDRAAYKGTLYRRDHVVMGAALESRIGCALLIEALKESEAGDVQIVFAAQEHLDGRGLRAISTGHMVREALGIGLVNAQPNAVSNTPVRLGAGPAVVVQDGAHVAHPGLLSRLKEAAARKGITVQEYVSRDGAKGPGFLQRTSGGVPTALIGIPARNTSGIGQIVHLGDVMDAVELLREYL